MRLWRWLRRRKRPRVPHVAPARRNPSMNAQGLRLLGEVSAAVCDKARRGGAPPPCPYCGGERLVARGPEQGGYCTTHGQPWRRWRCSDCLAEMDLPA